MSRWPERRITHAVAFFCVAGLLAGLISVVSLGVLGCSRPQEPSATGPAVPAAGVGRASAPEAEAPSAAVPGAAGAGAVSQPAAATADLAKPLKKAELFVRLPEEICNTPDAMTLLPDGSIILSVPNFNDVSQPPVLMKITPDNQVEKFLDLPPNPETGKPFGALGICVAPNGDLFLADYQAEGKQKSRVCRIKMENGMPREIGPAVEGFSISNAVICRDGYLYVSDTQIDAEKRPVISGVFRFKLEDLENAVIKLAEPLIHDPHLIATIETHSTELSLGADGLCFDDDGNLYIGNFADGTVHRLRFDSEGKVVANEIFARADHMKCADGLFYDRTRKLIFVADSKVNAIHMISLDGRVQVLAQNGDTDGLDGGMDQPCEAIVRGNEVIVSNMDWPVPGLLNQKYDTPCTLSVIRLD